MITERKNKTRKPASVPKAVRQLLASLDRAIAATEDAKRARDELLKLSQDSKK